MSRNGVQIICRPIPHFQSVKTILVNIKSFKLLTEWRILENEGKMIWCPNEMPALMMCIWSMQWQVQVMRAQIIVRLRIWSNGSCDSERQSRGLRLGWLGRRHCDLVRGSVPAPAAQGSPGRGGQRTDETPPGPVAAAAAATLSDDWVGISYLNLLSQNRRLNGNFGRRGP